MGVLRPWKSFRKRSRSASKGSIPVASKSPACATLRRPKRRGSTKRSSLPEERRRMAWVCLATSVCGSQIRKLPVMPRWTIHWALENVGGAPAIVSTCGIDEACVPFRFRSARRRAGEGARATSFWSCSRSKTMCLPMRRTAAIRLCSRVAAIAEAGDFRGSFFWPSHTDSTASPVTRLASPRAMVSTSGSSGIDLGIEHLKPPRTRRFTKEILGRCRELRNSITRYFFRKVPCSSSWNACFSCS
jgi:hypothetical protein